MLSWEDLRQRAEVIEGERANELRQAYIDRFVDTESSYFKQRIAMKKQFKDGAFPTGYLWECLKHSELISEESFWDESLLGRHVYVLWDHLSSDMALIKDRWRFPKHAVLRLNYEDVLKGKQLLPEELYIFDETWNWSLIFTHETDRDNKPFNLKATPCG